MFLSKLWLFLIALVAAVAVMIALLLPRQTQRTLLRAESSRLATACGVIHILLGDDARNRVELVGAFARAPEIMNALEAAGAAESLDEARMKQVREVGDSVMKAIQGNRKPDFAILIDRRGRVVARVRIDEADFGDTAAGRPLVDDALAGYLRDDIWVYGGSMFLVSASPVVKQGSYAGAVVLGHKVTNELAAKLVKPLGVDMAFHLGADGVAGSRTIAFDHGEMLAQLGKLGDDLGSDCQVVTPIEVRAGTEEYTALVARLPGEARARNAFYSVIVKRPAELGLLAQLGALKENDLSFAAAPWVFAIAGGGFVLALGLGLALMYFEAERPIRRLVADASKLAGGNVERLSEDSHAGKAGSIARNVNRHIDKLGREARSAKNDLDQLLGPAPAGGLGGMGTIDLLATALPPVRPGGPAAAVAAPPPSEFRFQDGEAMPARTAGGAAPRDPFSSSPASRKPAGSGDPGTVPPELRTSGGAAPGSPRDPVNDSPGLRTSGSAAPGSPRDPVNDSPGLRTAGGFAAATLRDPAVDSSGSRRPVPAPPPPPRSATPPPFRAASPPVAPAAHPAAPPAPPPQPSQPQPSQPQPTMLSFDDDILARTGTTVPPEPRVDPYFQQVFEQFVQVKRSCNESISGLVYDRFAEKLVKNREELMTRTGCRDVRFTVYVKDGKAALKATPIKDA